MTLGAINTQDIGNALSQAGTILNPGTYTTTWNGAVVYTPAYGANVPGGLPANPGMTGALSSISPTMILLLGGIVFLMFSGGKR